MILLQTGLIAFAKQPLSYPADGKTLCTKQLQQAIDKISKNGGGRLTLSAGTYLTGGLMLRSGVELHLEEGATLLGSTNPYDYQPINVGPIADQRNDNASMALIMGDKAEHISITGSGTIDGQGLQLALNADSLHHTGERPDPHYNQRRQRCSEQARPKLFFFHGCKDIKVEGLTLRNSANWGLSFDLCEQVTLRQLDIENRAYWNNDGIDLTDCRHVVVADCKINTADDGVCLKSYHADSECYDIEVARCDIRSSASAVKFGTASWGGFRKIYVHDIKVRDTFRSAIAIESVDGGLTDSVLVERIDARNTGNAFFLRLGQRAGDRPSILRNITIRQLNCEVPFRRPDEAYDLRGPEVDFFHNPFPSSICGIPDHRIENVTLEDVEVSYPGRATKGMAYMPMWRIHDVPEQIEKYPEFSMFGELPAWALYVRHVDGLQLRDIRFSLRDTDFRQPLVFDDAIGVMTENVSIKPNQPIDCPENTVESIRQRYAEAKEYARTHTGENLSDGADFGEYYHLEARQWLPATGGHVEHTYLYYDELESDDDVIYKPHYLKFATTRFNYAAREYYQEFLYDPDGKVAFIYAYDPMTQLEGDESDMQYEFRFYFSRGRLIKSLIKRKRWDEKEFQQVYAGTTLEPACRSHYDELLSASSTMQQLFIDIEKEAY